MAAPVVMMGSTSGSAMTDYAQAAAGINASKVLGTTISVGPYEWREPPIADSFITTLFPNENNWHPLWHNDKLTILEHYGSVMDSALPQPEKDRIGARIRATVQAVPQVAATARVYQCIIAIVIVFIIMFFIGSNIYIWAVVAAITLYGLYKYYDATTLAPADGYEDWVRFQTDLNSQLSSGKTYKAVLDTYRQEKTEEDRFEQQLAAQRSASRAPASTYNINLGSLTKLF